MARVQMQVSPEIMPSNIGPTYQSAAGADPDAFGAAQGQALQGLGQQLQQSAGVFATIAATHQDKTDELLVMDASTRLMKSNAESWGWYGTRQGKGAVDDLLTYQQRIQKAYDDGMATMPTEQARQMFARQGRTLTNQFWLYGQNHSTTEHTSWMTTSAGSRLAELQSQAILAANGGPAAVSGFVDTGADEVRRFNEAAGFDPATVDQKIAEYKGDSYFNVIKTLVDQGDVTRAGALYESVKTDLDPSSMVKIETALKGPQGNLVTNAQVDTLLGSRWDGGGGVSTSPIRPGQPVYPMPSYLKPNEVAAVSTVNPQLQQVMARAAQISKVPFYIPPEWGGRRDAEGQAEMVRRGWSTTMNSNHLSGDALDIQPVRNMDGLTGPDPNWDEGYAEVQRAMTQAATELGVHVEWGGDWKNFVDKPHWQLAGTHSPTDPLGVRGAVGEGYNPAMPVRVPSNLAPLFASAQGAFPLLPPNLLATVAQAESAFSPDVISGKRRSSAGAVGLMQFMPGTAAQFGINPTNASQSIWAAGQYLSQMTKKFSAFTSPSQAVQLAVIGYNWGPERAERWFKAGADPAKLPDETRAYVTKIFGASGMQIGPAVDPFGNSMNAEQQAAFAQVLALAAGQTPTSVAQIATAPSTDLSPDIAPGAPAQDRAPIEYGMPDKGEVVARAIEMNQGNPDQLRKTIAGINARYTEFETMTAAERKSMDGSFTDLVAGAMHGTEGLQLPEDRIRYLYPPARAEHMIEEFKTAEVVGTAVKGLRFATPEQIALTRIDVASDTGDYAQVVRQHLGAAATPGTTEAAAQDAAAYRIMRDGRVRFGELMQDRQQALFGDNADPATYVLQDPTVKAAAQALTANPSPETLQDFFSKTLGVQAHLGVPPQDQHVLTRNDAQRTAQLILDPATDAAAFLQQRETQVGSHWNKYFHDLVDLGKLPPTYQMIAMLPSARDQSLMSRALREFAGRDDPKISWDDLLGAGMVPGVATTGDNGAKQIREAISNDGTVQKYINSLSQSGGDLQQGNDVREALNVLGYAFMKYQHNDAADAAANAKAAFLSQYDFANYGGAAVPKVRLAAINNSINTTMESLDPKMLAPGPGVGSLGMPSIEAWWAQTKGHPLWVTNEDNTGVKLIAVDGSVVRYKDGHAVELNFDSVPAAPTPSERGQAERRGYVNEVRRRNGQPPLEAEPVTPEAQPAQPPIEVPRAENGAPIWGQDPGMGAQENVAPQSMNEVGTLEATPVSAELIPPDAAKGVINLLNPEGSPAVPNPLTPTENVVSTEGQAVLAATAQEVRAGEAAGVPAREAAGLPALPAGQLNRRNFEYSMQVNNMTKEELVKRLAHDYGIPEKEVREGAEREPEKGTPILQAVGPETAREYKAIQGGALTKENFDATAKLYPMLDHDQLVQTISDLYGIPKADIEKAIK